MSSWQEQWPVPRRRRSRQIFVGNVPIGGGAPVAVQSMTNTDTRDVEATLAQIYALAAEGCEIVRVAVPDKKAARALREIVPHSPVPVIADIHFDHRLALMALEAGVHGLRLNPGNIGGEDKVRAVVEAARARKVPIRIGVNVGSLPRHLQEDPRPLPVRMVEAALEHIRILEEMEFFDIKVSLKAFDVPTTVAAYRLLAEKVDYPFHIGITEAGTPKAGSIRSAVGLGTLLWLGLGDTIRVSLSGDPVEEVYVAYEILKSLNLRQRGATMVACPSCGRAEIDIVGLARQVEARLQALQVPVKVAVMGCVVNGPGEARDADVGVAGGRGKGVIFRKGKVVRTVPEAQMLEALWEEVLRVVEEAYPEHAERVRAAGTA